MHQIDCKDMRDKGSHFPDVESKRNTTTVQQKSQRVREREIPKIDLEAIREGSVIGAGAAALLGCFPLPCTSTHTHTQILGGLGIRGGGEENPVALVGVRRVIPAGSEVSPCGNGGIPGCQPVKTRF